MLCTVKVPFKVFEDTALLLLRDSIMIIRQVSTVSTNALCQMHYAKPKNETLPRNPALTLVLSGEVCSASLSLFYHRTSGGVTVPQSQDFYSLICRR